MCLLEFHCRQKYETFRRRIVRYFSTLFKMRWQCVNVVLFLTYDFIRHLNTDAFLCRKPGELNSRLSFIRQIVILDWNASQKGEICSVRGFVVKRRKRCSKTVRPSAWEFRWVFSTEIYANFAMWFGLHVIHIFMEKLYHLLGFCAKKIFFVSSNENHV